jgi:protein-disulfide isomerase
MKTRNLLLILAIVVLVAAAAIFYFVNRSEVASLPEPAATAVTAETTGSTAKPAAGDDIMVPGPLGEQALGDPKAPMVVIEYASMTCTHCQRFHSTVYPEFKKKYVDTGKVYFILREFPLDPLATSAFMLARCAPGERYFPIVDLLFDRQRDWAFVDDPATALLNVVKQAGFTQESFKACLTNQTILDGVNWVKNRGSDKFGVDATPTFFFNGVKKAGELSLEEIDKLVAQ